MTDLDKIILNVTGDNDPRDWKYPSEVLIGNTKQEFSRRPLMPEVRDQGPYGSCIGQTARTVMEDQDYESMSLSPMCIYKNSQFYDNRPGEDYSGSNFSAACKALTKDGVCKEELWPYGHMTGNPGWRTDAESRKVHSYYTLDLKQTDDIKRLLEKESLMIAFRVSRAIFYTPESGIVDDDHYLGYRLAGGHAVALVGYTEIDGRLYWEMQNSWGKEWGNEGFFYMSDDLLRKIVLDKLYVLVTKVDHQRELDSHKAQTKKMNFLEKIVFKIRKFIRNLF